MQEKRCALPPTWGCSSLVIQHHNNDELTFLKLMVVMINHIKMTQIPYIDKGSMFLSGQVSHKSNSSNLFWNLENSVLVQTLSYRTKISDHLLLIGFFHKLISIQDVGINMLHLHEAQQLPSL